MKINTFILSISLLITSCISELSNYSDNYNESYITEDSLNKLKLLIDSSYSKSETQELKDLLRSREYSGMHQDAFNYLFPILAYHFITQCGMGNMTNSINCLKSNNYSYKPIDKCSIKSSNASNASTTKSYLVTNKRSTNISNSNKVNSNRTYRSGSNSYSTSRSNSRNSGSYHPSRSTSRSSGSRSWSSSRSSSRRR